MLLLLLLFLLLLIFYIRGQLCKHYCEQKHLANIFLLIPGMFEEYRVECVFSRVQHSHMPSLSRTWLSSTGELSCSKNTKFRSTPWNSAIR